MHITVSNGRYRPGVTNSRPDRAVFHYSCYSPTSIGMSVSAPFMRGAATRLAFKYNAQRARFVPINRQKGVDTRLCRTRLLRQVGNASIEFYRLAIECCFFF